MRSILLTALIGLIGIVVCFLPPRGAVLAQALDKLPVWQRTLIDVEGNIFVLLAAFLLGCCGLFAALRMRNTPHGETPAEWFGIVGTRAEFTFLYSLGAIVGSAVGLISLAIR